MAARLYLTWVPSGSRIEHAAQTVSKGVSIAADVLNKSDAVENLTKWVPSGHPYLARDFSSSFLFALGRVHRRSHGNAERDGALLISAAPDSACQTLLAALIVSVSQASAGQRIPVGSPVLQG